MVMREKRVLVVNSAIPRGKSAAFRGYLCRDDLMSLDAKEQSHLSELLQWILRAFCDTMLVFLKNSGVYEIQDLADFHTDLNCMDQQEWCDSREEYTFHAASNCPNQTPVSSL